MEIIGKVIEIFDVQEITQKFSKRSIVIETDDQYPQVLEVQFANDRMKLVDKMSIGQNVEISINIRGRKWSGPKGDKYFVSLDGWRVQNAGGGGGGQGGGGGGGGGQGGGFKPPPAGGDDDDIPFSPNFYV